MVKFWKRKDIEGMRQLEEELDRLKEKADDLKVKHKENAGTSIIIKLDIKVISL